MPARSKEGGSEVRAAGRAGRQTGRDARTERERERERERKEKDDACQVTISAAPHFTLESRLTPAAEPLAQR